MDCRSQILLKDFFQGYLFGIQFAYAVHLTENLIFQQRKSKTRGLLMQYIFACLSAPLRTIDAMNKWSII